jgi:hypothetical protein
MTYPRVAPLLAASKWTGGGAAENVAEPTPAYAGLIVSR